MRRAFILGVTAALLAAMAGIPASAAAGAGTAAGSGAGPGSNSVTPEIRAAVERFAPVLAFDRSAKGFPMDAQEYFEERLEPEIYQDDGQEKIRFVHPGTGPPGAVANNDFDALTAGDGVPTYYTVSVSPDTDALRIGYWWFYGYQDKCETFLYHAGNHDADWENVTVTTSPDRQRIERLTYHQHGGRYTRSTTDGNSPEAALPGWITGQDKRPFPWYPTADDPQRRPLVYVGQISHGSYHFKRTLRTHDTCLYWRDWRDPDPGDYWDSSTNLIHIDPAHSEQTWMRAEFATDDPSLTFEHEGFDYQVGNWFWGWRWTPPPTSSTNPAGPKRGRPWDYRHCRNGSSADWLQTRACEKSHGWPAWIEMSMWSMNVEREVPTDPLVALFNLRLTAVHLGVGTQPAEQVRVTAELPAGLNWQASSLDGSCSVETLLLTCEMDDMLDTETVVLLWTEIDGTVERSLDIEAVATWKARQQPIESARAEASLQPAVCGGRPATVWGTADGDVLLGTGGDDVIVGFDGDDTITGLGGRDLICGGPGDDTIDAGAGHDRMYGGRGNDTIRGGSGADWVYGEGGHDLIVGRGGNDRLNGDAGRDELQGDGGSDRLDGGRGRDVMNGKGGNDTFFANDRRRDRLNGGRGFDRAKVDAKDVCSRVEVLRLA